MLVSDLGMPGEDGFSLIRRVRSPPPGEGGDTPAAALTANARGEDRRRALDSGFQTHVPKPGDPDEVPLSLRGRRGILPRPKTSLIHSLQVLGVPTPYSFARPHPISPRSRWDILINGSIINRLLDEVRDAAVQVVPPSEAENGHPEPQMK